MEPVSIDPHEIARTNGARMESEVLRRLAEFTQVRASECMGVSASTVSRMTEDLGKYCQLLAALGFQLAPHDAVVTTQIEMTYMRIMLKKVNDADLAAKGLL